MKHLKAEPAGATQQLINEKIVKMHTAVYRGQYGCAVHIKHLFQYIFSPPLKDDAFNKGFFFLQSAS